MRVELPLTCGQPAQFFVTAVNSISWMSELVATPSLVASPGMPSPAKVVAFEPSTFIPGQFTVEWIAAANSAVEVSSWWIVVYECDQSDAATAVVNVTVADATARSAVVGTGGVVMPIRQRNFRDIEASEGDCRAPGPLFIDHCYSAGVAPITPAGVRGPVSNLFPSKQHSGQIQPTSATMTDVIPANGSLAVAFVVSCAAVTPTSPVVVPFATRSAQDAGVQYAVVLMAVPLDSSSSAGAAVVTSVVQLRANDTMYTGEVYDLKNGVAYSVSTMVVSLSTGVSNASTPMTAVPCSVPTAPTAVDLVLDGTELGFC